MNFLRNLFKPDARKVEVLADEVAFNLRLIRNQQNEIDVLRSQVETAKMAAGFLRTHEFNDEDMARCMSLLDKALAIDVPTYGRIIDDYLEMKTR